MAVEVWEEVGDDEGEVVEGEVGGPTQGADNGSFLLGCPPGKRVRSGGVVKAVVWAAFAPLANGLGADAVAPGQDAGGLARAGDLGPDGRRGAGIGVNLEPGSLPSLLRRPEAFEAVGLLNNGQPNGIPTMLCDQTTEEYRTLLDAAGLELSRVVPTKAGQAIVEAVPRSGVLHKS